MVGLAVEALRKRLTSPAGLALLQLVERASDAAALAQAVTAVLDETERAGKGGAATPKANWVDALTVWEDFSLSTPSRGKHRAGFFKGFLALQKGAAELHVPYSAIESVAIFDTVPEAPEKVLILLQLKSEAGLTHGAGKKPLEGVLAHFGRTQTVALAHPHPSAPGQRLEGLAPVVFCTLLGLFQVTNFTTPRRDVFCGAQHEPCFRAHVKVNLGWVFPLAGSLCFLERPTLCVAVGALRALQFTRLKSGSASFDLVAHVRGSGAKPLEFCHVPRSEVPAIQAWAEQRGVAVLSEDDDVEDLPSPSKAGANVSGNGAGRKREASGAVDENAAAGDPEEEEDDSDAEDESYEPGRPSASEEEGGGRPKRKRSTDGSEEVDLGEEDSQEDSEESSSGSGSDACELVSEDDIPAAKMASKPRQAGGGKRAAS